MTNSSARVTESNEVSINGTRFPIIGRVRTSLVSILPAKISIGDYSLADDQIASSWIINDQRGGPGIEEMDESIHGNRCWWSNCDTRSKGHLFLPPAVTALTLPSFVTPTWADLEFDAWTDATTLTNWTTDSLTIAREATTKYSGNFSCKLNDTTDGKLYADCSNWTTDFRGRTYQFGCYVKTNEASIVRFSVSSKTNESDRTYSGYHTGGNAWEKLTVNFTVDSAATRIRLYVGKADSVGGSHYADLAAIDVQPANGTLNHWCIYNSNLYVASGNLLLKLNTTTGASLDYVYNFTTNITGIKASCDGALYICVGNADAYWYMTTAEVFAQTDETAANLPIHWEDKLFVMSTAGAIKYDVDPDTASPAMTANGTLDFIESNSIQHLITSKDADDAEIIYAVAKSGLYAHDYANARFLATALSYPQHANSGLGAVVYHDSLFITAGLSVYKYVAGSTAQVVEVGLDRDDGLPTEYDGEFTSLINGHGYMYATLDSSKVSGTGTSTLWSYDDAAWWCVWKGTTTDDVTTGGIVASITVNSVATYRLYFDHNDIPYYITLYRGNKNPRKISGYPFTTSADHITAIFDGAWIGSKCALSQDLFCDGMDTSDTITVYYRLDDDCYGDLTTNWTLMEVISKDGEHNLNFGDNSEGKLFKKIQFKFSLVGTASTSPDMLWAKFRYLKYTDKKWGWQCRTDLSRPYKGLSPTELKDKIEELANPGSLVEFSFSDSTGSKHTHMVRLVNCTGAEKTGREYKGILEMSLIAP